LLRDGEIDHSINDIEPGVDPPGRLPRTLSPPETVVKVKLLGGFEVNVDERPVTVPRGNVATLAKLVVLHRGLLPIDKAIESIWPCSDLPTGRNRLRNVLARANAALGARPCDGGVIQRDGDLFVLSNEANYSVDYWSATDDATQLVRAPAPTIEALTDAVAALTPQLLPGDSYEAWLADPQADRVRLLVHLARRQFEVACDDGLNYIARCALELCHELDPLSADTTFAHESMPNPYQLLPASAMR